MNKPEMVLVDLDGTLVDSVPDLAYSIDEMMRELGLPEWGEAQVREWVGNGAERLVKRALTGEMEAEPEPALFERAYPLFQERYAENCCCNSRLYPGVLEGLDYLQSAGCKLGCVTNKPARFTEPLLKALEISDYFQITISGDSLPKKKPDPLPLLHAAEQLGVSPESSLMLGDSINDVKAARAAGFSVICVSYGYNHGRDIREAEPDGVVDSLAELGGLYAYNDLIRP